MNSTDARASLLETNPVHDAAVNHLLRRERTTEYWPVPAYLRPEFTAAADTSDSRQLDENKTNRIIISSTPSLHFLSIFASFSVAPGSSVVQINAQFSISFRHFPPCCFCRLLRRARRLLLSTVPTRPKRLPPLTGTAAAYAVANDVWWMKVGQHTI